jgi:tetratricopeptide (TPR) repeat protein
MKPRICHLILAVVLALGEGQFATAEPAALGELCVAASKAETAKDFATAIGHMKTYQQRGGEPFFAAIKLGWLHFNHGDFAEARRCYTQAATLQPASINARLGVLNAAVALKDVRRTAQAATALLAVEPTNYQALMALAGLHFAQHDYRQAGAEYSRVLINYPDDPDALSGAAWAALRGGDKAAALARFTTLLGRDPAYPKARQGFQQAGS